jgi:hypothetical protein
MTNNSKKNLELIKALAEVDRLKSENTELQKNANELSELFNIDYSDLFDKELDNKVRRFQDENEKLVRNYRELAFEFAQLWFQVKGIVDVNDNIKK